MSINAQALASFSIGVMSRYVWSNTQNSSSGANVVYGIYEPTFFPVFDRDKSDGTQNLCLRVEIESDRTQHVAEDAVRQAKNVKDSQSLSLMRLPLAGATFSLGPDDGTDDLYPNIAPRTFDDKINGIKERDVCFKLPKGLIKTTNDIESFANRSVLHVRYLMSTERSSTSTCTLGMTVANKAIFSNSLHGPAGTSSTTSLDVAVTRNQLAHAISNGDIVVTQKCRRSSGSDESEKLVREDAAKMLPILIENLAVERRDWTKAMDTISNYGFPGDDAKVALTSYMSKLDQEAKTSTNSLVNVKGGVEGSFLGIASGKANADVTKQDINDVLSKVDGEVNWVGHKIVPSTLNVVILRTGEQNSSITLQASESIVFGDDVSSGQQRIAIHRSADVMPWSVPEGRTVGATIGAKCEVLSQSAPWLTLKRTGVGVCTARFAAGTFSSPPICVATSQGTNGAFHSKDTNLVDYAYGIRINGPLGIGNPDATGATFAHMYLELISTPVPVGMGSNESFSIICLGGTK